MTDCQHPNRTLLRSIPAGDAETVRMWRCDDCGHIWAEHQFGPGQPLQVCSGECTDCPMWKQPEEESSK